MGENMPKLNDNSGISINIKWLIQIIVLVGGAVLLYTRLETRVKDNEADIKSIRFNQNTYIFPDIRVLEEDIIEYKLERERVRKDIQMLKNQKNK